jgi:hypothetical protein
VDRLPALFRENGVDAPDPRRIPWPIFRALVPVLSRVGPEKQRTLFKNLPHFLEYLGSRLDFANGETRVLLNSIGVPRPPMEEALPAVVRYYLDGWKARRAGPVQSGV